MKVRHTAMLGFVSLLACRQGPITEWRPRFPSHEYAPKTTLAVRIREPAELGECAERIGVVHADGEPSEVIEAAAREAAEHGGTHYIVKLDESSSHLETRGSATTWGNTNFAVTHARAETHEVVTRHIAVHVYRKCD
jgi:hypothetical protein